MLIKSLNILKVATLIAAAVLVIIGIIKGMQNTYFHLGIIFLLACSVISVILRRQTK